MALYKVKAAIDFKAGLNEGLDDSSIKTELIKAENLVVSRLGKFEPRKGFTAMPTESLGSTKISKLISYGGILRGFSDSSLYLYVDALDMNYWISCGDIAKIHTKTIPLNSGYTVEQKRPYHAVGTGLMCVTYTVDGATQYDILSLQGSVIISKQIAATEAYAKVIYKSGNFVIFYLDSNDLHMLVVPERNPTTSTDIILDTDFTYTFKMFDYSTKWLSMLYKNSTDGNLTCFYFSLDGTIATLDDKIQEKINTGVPIDANTSFISNKDVDINYKIVTNIAGDITYIELDQEFNVDVNSVVDTGNSSVGIPSVAVVDGDSVVLMSYGTGLDAYIKKHTVGGSTDILCRSLKHASNIFEFGSRYYVIASHEDEFQNAYIILDVETGKPEGRLEYLTGAGHLDYLLHFEDGCIITPTVKKVIRDQSSFLSNTGLNLNLISDPEQFQTTVFSKSLLISGSMLSMFDGSSIVEHGFLFYPNNIELVGSTGSGSLQTDKSYFYQVCYAWYDNNGMLHRSAPCITKQVDTTGTINTVTLTIPTLRVTKKEKVAIEIYRSEADGATNYKLAVVQNDPTVDTITYVDEADDEAVLGNEPLYTEGNILANGSINSCSVMTTHQNRVFAVSQSDSKKIYYSHERAEGFPAEFSDYLTLSLPVKEDITAIHGLGDFLVVFTQNTVGVVTGVGADPTGFGATFNFEYITQDIGCVSIDSLVESNKGLYFQSNKGIYLMTKGGGLGFAGQAVKTKKYNITSAVALTDKNEVRFFSDEGTLIYHEEYGLWTTANLQALSALYHDNKIHLVDIDNNLLIENSEYSDRGDAIVTRLQTGWIQLADIRGFQRIYKAIFRGLTIGSHHVTINVYYDGKDDVPASSYQKEFLENESTWGDIKWGDSIEESEGGSYSIPVRLGRKCESVSFEVIVDGIDNKPTGQAALTGVMVEYGTKRGSRKSSRSKRAS